ncbi:hypothetical protein C8R46DRAFT_277224 [Mycena filopes]|nr:hypothetical protein C8R46DRAFT_277224 [Mycena filopes]
MLVETPHAFVDSVAAREARAVDRALLVDIEAQISNLERTLSQLRTAKELAQARLDAFKYPVLTLPVEIVSEIFTQILPPYPLCPRLVGLSSPTLVTHICHLWREIAFRTPALWRAVDLRLDEGDVFVDTQVSIANLWLQRSRSCPLSIKIHSELESDVSPLIATVVPHRARWEHLSVDLALSDLPLLSGSMPLLRSILLTVQSFTPPTTVVSLLPAPLLRSATLNDITAKAIRLPWVQLTSLTLHRVFPSECAPILQQTPYLVHCALTLFCDDPAADAPSQISLLHLESLTMMERQVDEALPVTGYLETFFVPALSRLRVPESFLGPDPIEYLRSFTSNSASKLQDVVITGDEIKFIDAYQGAFPSIGRFSFRRYRRDEQDEILERLGYDELHANPETE